MTNEKIIISKEKMCSFLFFTAYGIYLFVTLLNTTFFSMYYSSGLVKNIMIICCLILLFNELVFNTKIKNIWFLILCAIGFLIMSLHINGITMLPLFLLIYSSRNIKFEKIAKFTMIISSIMLIITILSAKLGIITNYVYISKNRIREYLGFRYSLYPQIIMFNITALYLYLNREKHKKISYVILICLNSLMFRYTDSRLSFYLSIFLVFIFFILNIKKDILNNRKIVCSLMVISFIICWFVAYYSAVLYNPSNKLMYKINAVFEKRLYFGQQSLDTYSLNLLGHDVSYIGNGLNKEGEKTIGVYSHVDSFYLNFTEKYGLITMWILIIMLTISAYKMYKDKNYYGLVIFGILALKGLIDDLQMYICYNTFWLLIGQYILKDIKKVKQNDVVENDNKLISKDEI